ncbi:hypothetical protein [Actinomadura luteofluorescens]|uniref:hypothetical protein n=1 Tax=Actinomadura luteofluorescens TaxID=46163 RepID=UPI0030CF723B
METVSSAADAAEAKAGLRDAFPAWSIIHTRDTGRWWATRGPLTREILDRPSDVCADTAEELADKIREVTRDE